MFPTRRYRLERAIAVGGMAEVWEAYSYDLGRSVAIKRVLPHLQGDPAIKRMFFDEARIARCLDHPNITNTYDYGYVDERAFIVMELVDGIDARRAVSIGRTIGQPIPEAIALLVISAVARGLHHAHQLRDAHGRPMGIIHRDVNPPNIMIGRDGSVKISDFGIARARVRHERTATGVVKGKEGYVTPEQALGKEMTNAVDVYMLGATLHELVVGWPPLRGWQDTNRRFMGGPLPLSPALTAGSTVLIRRCMELKPSKRPTAAQVESAALKLATTVHRNRVGDNELIARWVGPVIEAFEAQGALDVLLGVNLDDTEPFGHELTLIDDA